MVDFEVAAIKREAALQIVRMLHARMTKREMTANILRAFDIPGKICAKCGRNRPMSLFHRSRINKDGRASYCKLCRSKLKKASTPIVQQANN
jgi:hypothetical protein